MPTKSLKSRIDKLINSLGGTDKPGLAEIRNELFTFARLAEALEDNQATREAEAKIAVLEAALEKSNAENSNLKIKLQTANAEIQRFRAERKKQEENEREIPPIQFRFSSGCLANTAAVIGWELMKFPALSTSLRTRPRFTLIAWKKLDWLRGDTTLMTHWFGIARCPETNSSWPSAWLAKKSKRHTNMPTFRRYSMTLC